MTRYQHYPKTFFQKICAADLWKDPAQPRVNALKYHEYPVRSDGET